MERFVILLHVVALLTAAVPLHLVAARRPALQPLWAGPPDRRGNLVRAGEFTPVEHFEPFCSFTVTQKGLQHCYSPKDIAEYVIVRRGLYIHKFLHIVVYQWVLFRYLKAVIPECR